MPPQPLPLRTPPDARTSTALAAAAAAEARFTSACGRLTAALDAARAAGFLRDGGDSADGGGQEGAAAVEENEGAGGQPSTTDGRPASPSSPPLPSPPPGTAAAAAGAPPSRPPPPSPALTAGRLGALARELAALRAVMAELGAEVGGGGGRERGGGGGGPPPSTSPAVRLIPRSPLVALPVPHTRARRTSGAPPVMKAAGGGVGRRAPSPPPPSPPCRRPPSTVPVGRVPPAIWDTAPRVLARRPARVEAAVAGYAVGRARRRPVVG